MIWHKPSASDVRARLKAKGWPWPLVELIIARGIIDGTIGTDR